ncbi:MAG: hypothetical protein Q9208_008280 [Pyrenodesmia sp. 3 TL-2023]
MELLNLQSPTLRVPETQVTSPSPPEDMTDGGLNSLTLNEARGNLPNETYIRLVHISSEQSTLKLRYLEMLAENVPAYNALSYTWGPPSTDPSENLLMVRLPGLWWIDAICINQDDPVEKSHQVKGMRRIYAKAEKLYVWLGPAGDESESAVELLHQLGRFTDRDNLVEYGYKEPTLRFHDDEFERLGLPKTDSPKWLSLVALLNRPYFERIWVVQELAVAKQEISVLCGDVIFPWSVEGDTPFQAIDLA